MGCFPIWKKKKDAADLGPCRAHHESPFCDAPSMKAGVMRRMRRVLMFSHLTIAQATVHAERTWRVAPNTKAAPPVRRVTSILDHRHSFCRQLRVRLPRLPPLRPRVVSFAENAALSSATLAPSSVANVAISCEC